MYINNNQINYWRKIANIVVWNKIPKKIFEKKKILFVGMEMES